MDRLMKRIRDGVAAVTDKDLDELKLRPIEKDEDVVGEVTDMALRRLFAFRRKLLASNAKLKEELKAKGLVHAGGFQVHHNPNKCSLCQEIAVLIAEKEFETTVGQIFWTVAGASLSVKATIDQTFPQAGTLAVVDGWKIVATPEQDDGMVIMGVMIPRTT